MKYKLLIMFLAIFALISLSGAASLSGVSSASPDASSSSSSSFGTPPSVPPDVYLNQTFYINVSENSGYHNYSIAVYLGADNDTGLSPLYYYEHHSANRNFSMAVKAPAECEYIYGYINETAENSSNKYVSHVYSISPINVSAPITFNATIKNIDPVPIKNITVTYTVTHDKSPLIIGISHIKEIKANSTYKDNITVPSATIHKGTDVMTITTNNPVLTISGKSSVTFYNGHPPNYDWVYYIAAVAVAFSAFLIIASGRRNTVKVPKWKRSKTPKKGSKLQKAK